MTRAHRPRGSPASAVQIRVCPRRPHPVHVGEARHWGDLAWSPRSKKGGGGLITGRNAGRKSRGDRGREPGVQARRSGSSASEPISG